MNSEPTMMSRKRALVFGVYLIALNLALLYILLKVWPGEIPPGIDDRVERFLGNRLVLPMPPEIRYLFIVAVAGALGSYIHVATSFATYAGNRQLVESWGWWYILRPFIGTALAVIIYFVVRGGLITGNEGVKNLNLYGVTAISGMAGMFSRQATDKLEEVFTNLFRTAKSSERADPLKEKTAQEPASAPPTEKPTAGSGTGNP